MKTKLRSTVKPVLIIAFGILAVSLLFYMIDTVFDGILVDWFQKTYTMYYGYPMEEGGYYSEYNLNWSKLKVHALIALIIITVFCISLVLLSGRISKKRARKQTVDDISKMIHTYISQDIDSADVFSDEYAKISAEMVEIKADINRKEQVLKEESSRKNDLIAYLAHDLKTPLTSVIGYLSLLDEVPEMPVEQRAKYVNISLDKALKLEKLIDEFFEITRYNLQKINLLKEDIDLKYMLIQMADEFYPILKAHGNTIEIKSEEVTVHADPIKSARVFNNILKNAVAYSYPNSVIRVVVLTNRDNVFIQFHNNGQTIPKQKLEAIFDKFIRLDDARNSNTGGAGLGLAIAKEIVSLHGGTIKAESENEHTVFTVGLPL